MITNFLPQELPPHFQAFPCGAPKTPWSQDPDEWGPSMLRESLEGVGSYTG